MNKTTIKNLRNYARKNKQPISFILEEAVNEYLAKTAVRPAFTQSMNKVLEENSELLRKLAK